MFRMWQVFVFSLVPLALVFIGVISASYHGVDSAKENLPSAQAGGQAAPPPPPPPPGATVLQLTAQNLAFNPRSLSAPSGSPVTVQMDNRDAGVQHNFALYNNQSASQRIFVGDLDAGPAIKNYTFDAPPPGTYFFRCDVHPEQMTGSFTVR